MALFIYLIDVRGRDMHRDSKGFVKVVETKADNRECKGVFRSEWGVVFTRKKRGKGRL